jgi:hypothetical protein
MEDPHYYRRQAARARLLAGRVHQQDAVALLHKFAQEYSEIAEDLQSGAVTIRHRERMPQYRRRMGR